MPDVPETKPERLSMRSTDLTANQLEAIAGKLAPMVDYFKGFEERMVAL